MMLKQILGAALAATASANIWTLRKNADVYVTDSSGKDVKASIKTVTEDVVVLHVPNYRVSDRVTPLHQDQADLKSVPEFSDFLAPKSLDELSDFLATSEQTVLCHSGASVPQYSVSTSDVAVLKGMQSDRNSNILLKVPRHRVLWASSPRNQLFLSTDDLWWKKDNMDVLVARSKSRALQLNQRFNARTYNILQSLWTPMVAYFDTVLGDLANPTTEKIAVMRALLCTSPQASFKNHAAAKQAEGVTSISEKRSLFGSTAVPEFKLGDANVGGRISADEFFAFVVRNELEFAHIAATSDSDIPSQKLANGLKFAFAEIRKGLITNVAVSPSNWQQLKFTKTEKGVLSANFLYHYSLDGDRFHELALQGPLSYSTEPGTISRWLGSTNPNASTKTSTALTYASRPGRVISDFTKACRDGNFQACMLQGVMGNFAQFGNGGFGNPAFNTMALGALQDINRSDLRAAIKKAEGQPEATEVTKFLTDIEKVAASQPMSKTAKASLTISLLAAVAAVGWFAGPTVKGLLKRN